ncbi:glycoside hydrolase family 16 protein [Mesonia aestuariivivens]|uniref:Glycoside hydrolase family 16 protein n=1 Tax=Mesonia aestuariivivens TaxID=2796128 RepID=A0ABS6W331_9FLAO|nr:glycoside hydrolase family 16 protein [Mesonia aestuariivivens]MBW2962262.1 glycoside hydrolase family 16 protein [Mesonia aestuariivivens]
MKQLIINLITVYGVIFSASAQNVKLIWEENFAGDNLNIENWNYELGNGCPNLCGWGNNERQIYHKDYVKVKDGMLIITADKVGKNYYSGKINSKDKFEFKYGTVEIRAKVPGGQGLWPAFWMLGANINEVGWPASGEIDILEFVGKQPDTIYTSLHTPASFGETINSKQTSVKNITADFHTYKIEWSKDAIIFYLDDLEVYYFSPKDKNDKTYPYHHPFYFLLNMAVGGNFGGPKVDDSIFPQRFYIDYIHVYQ